MEDKETIIKGLVGSSTTQRRKSALLLRKQCHTHDVCDKLKEALALELGSSHWKTKVEIIKTIGLLGCSSALADVEEYLHDVAEFDLVKKEAALAWVRLKRVNLNDGEPILSILDSKFGYSAIEGALEALGYDRMIPDQKDSERIIRIIWDFGADRPKGYTDPRYGLAAACAGWNFSTANDFLKHCMRSDDTPLKYVASKAIKGNYSKLR